MTTEVRNPVFARVFDRLAAKSEDAGQGEHRRELLAGLAGRVIEVGAGNGLNFRHYPPEVTEVVALEPEPYLRERALEAAATARVPVRVQDGLADPLPARDGDFDAGVVSLVLCTVPDPAAALRELRRAIRPGGELRFYEHVVSERPRLARLQHGLQATVWPLFGGGCHPARDTVGSIAAAGFEVQRLRRFEFRPTVLQVPVAPHVLGVARRPA